MPVPDCFDYSGLVIQFDIRYCDPSCFVLLSQNCCSLFVLLNPLTSSPIPLYSLPSGIHQNALHNHDSVSVLLACLVYILDSVVDRYVFIAILLFILLIFFSLKCSFNISYNNGLVIMKSFSFFPCLISSLSAFRF